MRKRSHLKKTFSLLLLVLFALSSCTPEAATTDSTQVVSVIHTAAAETIVASIPTATNTLRPTITIEPTNTPMPSYTPATTTDLTPQTTLLAGDTTPCLSLILIGNMDPHIGEILNAEQTFKKSWRVQNNGSCPWLPGFRLVYVSGDKMSGGNAAVNKEVKPGTVMIFTIDMQAPEKPGNYVGFWRMYDNNGSSFGQNLEVNIVIPKPTKAPTETPKPTKTPKP